MLRGIVNYFDLFYPYRGYHPKAQAAGANQIALWREITIYLICVLGVLAGPFIPAALAGTPPPLGTLFDSANHIIWSAIIALGAMPVAYKLIFVPSNPFIVQCGFGLVTGFVAQKLVPVAIAMIQKLIS
jgi:hypothetical protein